MGNKIFRMGKLFSSTDIDGTIEHVGGTATQAYTKGSYFVGDDGYFYAVDENIDEGDSITLGTNCHRSSIASELANLTGDTATVRYNENTDRFEVLKNGVWVESIKAYAGNLILFDGTSFYAPYENGVYNRNTYDLVNGGFIINLPSVVAPLKTTNNTCSSLVFSNAINLTNYSALVVDTSVGTRTLDLTNITSNAYVTLTSMQGGDGSKGFEIGVSTQKEKFAFGYLNYKQITMTADIDIFGISLTK